LNEIAGRLRTLRDAGEAHKLVWFSEDHSFVDIQVDFCTLYGTPNYHNHSNLCDVSRKASFKLVMGDERPLGDFANARYIIIFGWNPTSATKWAHLPRIFTRAIENGAKLVVVDPYLSQTAARAHEWIPLRPGTDGALALALAHLLVTWNLYDAQFIKDWTVGFNEFAEFIADKTPEWAEKITDVPATTIRRLAQELGTTRPAVVDVWSGPGQHSNGVQGGRAIALLNALLGSIDRPGGMMLPERKGPAVAKVKGPTITQPRLDNVSQYPFGHKSGVYTDILSHMSAGDVAYMPKIGMVIFQNLVLAVPGTNTVVNALKKLEFLVVVDTMLSETAELADIVIPGTTYLERYDLTTNWVTWSSVSLRQPVVPPIFGQLPEYEFVVELGRRIGLKDTDNKDFFWDGRISGQRIESTKAWYEEYLSQQLLNGGPKITLEQLKALPGACWVDPTGTRYEKFRDPVTMPDGGTVDEKTGIVKDKSGAVVGVKIGNAVYKGFNTPSRRLEFYSALAASKKDRRGRPVDALPVYIPRDWLPDKDYPFYLINWKEASHTHTRTFNNPFLMELAGWNRLAINRGTAEKLGIADGDKIWVESPYGKDQAIARVTEGIHPEVVGWQHGFGHWALGRIARGKGTVDGQFNKTIADPISGMALHKEVCVRIYKAT
jgi:thiosulfate reductase/polysulfide reductase chain A